MRIKNIANPPHGFADFTLLCDFCGEEIGDEPANLEFYDLGEVFCLHKYCSDAFRLSHKTGRLYWVGLKEASISVRDGCENHRVNLRR